MFCTIITGSIFFALVSVCLFFARNSLKANNYASFTRQHKQELKLRLIFCIAGLTAISLFFIFSWFFTKHMIIPLENTRQKQTDFIASASHELRLPLAVIKTGLDNALSYTPSGGRIDMALKQQKSFLVFSFADTGYGIPDNEKTLIFDRFYRSDNAHSDKTHPGLGLCLAKEIISAHKGRIWVQDSKGGGSCFYVELPIAGQ